MSYHFDPGPLYKPYEKLVKIKLLDKEFEVPEGNILLRAFQFLAPEEVPNGKFCWNEECQYCRVHFIEAGEEKERIGLSCKMVVKEGMRITSCDQEIKYRLRDVLKKTDG